MDMHKWNASPSNEVDERKKQRGLLKHFARLFKKWRNIIVFGFIIIVIKLVK